MLQRQQSFRQQPPRSLSQVSAAVRAEEEREATASRRHAMRRWRTWSASTLAARPQSLSPTPSTSWRRGRAGEGQSARVSRRGQEGCTAASAVADRSEGKGRLGTAA